MIRLLGVHRPHPALTWLLSAVWIAVLYVAIYEVESPWLAGAVVGAVVITFFAVWPRKRKHEELACGFCGKSQREVRKLVAGPDVYICDECVRLSSDIIAAEEGGSDAVVLALQSSLQQLRPKDEAIRLIDAWLAVGGASSRASAARFARSGGNFTAAAYALEGLSDEERGSALFELASLRIVELDDLEAVPLLERVDAESLTPHEQIELRVLSAYARYESGADRAALIDEARNAIAELDGQSWSATMSRRMCAALEVRAALARPDVDAAEVLARAATETVPCALTWELLAIVLEERGDPGAHEARSKGQLCCDTECPRGRRLRGQSAAPFR
jgi:hypothetical protein